ncbi:MAG: lytic transglycosylase domain-containing protein [Burkholderiales bacterium]|nr:lytic transglycosylase domain-containing protein [Burkholderiales bacterium]
MQAFQSGGRALKTVSASVRVFLSDLGDGLLAVSHNSLALLGLVVLGGVIVIGGRADVRDLLEEQALDWLQARQEARFAPEPTEDEADMLAVDRATAADPSRLDRQQAFVAQWLSRRYRVAPEPVSRLVQEAWTLGGRFELEPTLILAIMAIESGFNPFAQSSVGAQGLMQVMTSVHDEKYEPFGGNHAAFDPVTNLRVGVEVLKECISRAGSLEGGLKYYVGAANLVDDGGYASKVLAEQTFLRQVVLGRQVPVTAKLPQPSASASSGVQLGATTATTTQLAMR